MIKEPIFSWNPDMGIASCTLDYKDTFFFGSAVCHDDDLDMMNEKTGCQIALHRAKIDYFKYLRDYELKPQIKALKQYYYTMAHSTHFNPKSYENKMLQRQIRSLEFDLTVVKQMLDIERQDLKEFIEKKDAFYKAIRKHRLEGNNN